MVAFPICQWRLSAPFPVPEGYPEAPSTLGEHVRRVRMDRGIEQKALARELGVTAGTLANWELRSTEPEVRHLPAVLHFLGFDPRPEGVTLADRVRRQREGLGLSQRALADRLQVDPTTVSDVERGTGPRSRRVRRAFENFVAG